jgi:uncharacterized damage-inducible protein DinB
MDRRASKVARICVVYSTVALLMCAAPAVAQSRGGLMGDLGDDVAVVEAKIVGLAKTMPPGAYSWRPSAGVRSTAEVLVHVAGDNYFMPALMGAPAPQSTGIDGKNNKTVAAFEARHLTREQIVAELTASFAFLKQAMRDTPDAQLEVRPKNSVRDTTTRATWIAAVTHLHEHLGQLIAYARSNNVTPPWSK